MKIHFWSPERKIQSCISLKKIIGRLNFSKNISIARNATKELNIDRSLCKMYDEPKNSLQFIRVFIPTKFANDNIYIIKCIADPLANFTCNQNNSKCVESHKDGWQKQNTAFEIYLRIGTKEKWSNSLKVSNRWSTTSKIFLNIWTGYLLPSCTSWSFICWYNDVFLTLKWFE